jgi:phytoene synthase
MRALDQLRKRLALAYVGIPSPCAADRAFADVVTRFGIPRALPEALLEGFAWDIAGRQYDGLEEVQAYAARVAGTVGAMMAIVMGIRSPDVVARACDLGVAMQLTNIARDVGEDARAGRLYLPRSWMSEAGIDVAAWLREPRPSAALGSVVQRLLRAADVIYDRTDAGIERLPPSCRPGIRVARVLYREIGRQVERQGYDAVSQRAVVPVGRKIALLARAPFALRSPEEHFAAPPLSAVRFLVDAVSVALPAPNAHHGSQLASVDAGSRIEWVVDLFARLERRDQLQRVASRPQ